MKISRVYLATMYVVLVAILVVGALNAYVGQWWVAAFCLFSAAVLVAGIAAARDMRKHYWR